MNEQPNLRLSFDLLVNAIGQVHAEMAVQAGRAVNMSLTLRNWLIGFYIAEYEQQGSDRAQYGDRLLARLSDDLLEAGVVRAEERELRRYRQFYTTYPQIRDSLTPELRTKLLPHGALTTQKIVKSARLQSLSSDSSKRNWQVNYE